MKASPGPAGERGQQCHPGGGDDTGDTVPVGTHCPALTGLSHLGDVHALLGGHEAQHGEDDEAGKEAGGAVDHGQDVGIPAGRAGQGGAGAAPGDTPGERPAAGTALPVAVIVEAVVAAQRGQGAQPDGIGEEDLGASVDPDLGHEGGRRGAGRVPGGCPAPSPLLPFPLPSPAPRPAWTSRVSGSRRCHPVPRAASLRGPAAG